eukprot:TRINITY_DN10383_c0_g1_i1.p2 TRINITY_DN10383_c0_g1~~TRINITY_DN10383_c0_g1_i1.p2  ORF type:complete len:411 (-),score=113.88 TRINITY_DN10383_c0_g1_i1:160-1392(-)
MEPCVDDLVPELQKLFISKDFNTSERTFDQSFECMLAFVDDLDEPLDPEEFPDWTGKVGGRPVWLDPLRLPAASLLQCGTCSKQMSLLVQLSCSLDQDDSYLRMLYVFCCRNGECHASDFRKCFKVLRCQMNLENEFYRKRSGKQPFAVDWTAKRSATCCVCGGVGDKRCGGCKRMCYCSKEHQVAHWNAGHERQCKAYAAAPAEVVANDVNHAARSYWSLAESQLSFKLPHLFPEYILDAEPEELDKVNAADGDEDKAQRLLKEYATKKKTASDGDFSDVSGSSEGGFSADKTFVAFQRRIKAYPDQVLRYYAHQPHRKPLWIGSQGQPQYSDIPKCKCGSPRMFEFQLMPQLLYELKVDNVQAKSIDWGVLAVYTCAKGCDPLRRDGAKPHCGGYTEEFLWRQNVASS